MKTATRRRATQLALAALGAGVLASRAGHAVVFDDRGEMRLGMRAYTAVRVGTDQMGGEDDPLTFPSSPPGHVRQHRYFLELKLDHDIRRLATTTKGLAWLLGWFAPSKLRYSLQYRGEGEGIYDYGPGEFQHQYRKTAELRLDTPDAAGLSSTVPEELIRRRVDRLRRLGRQRHRFFLGYLDVEKGPVFVRIGRQVLAWGETDTFRLLDNINPLDDSFGGFMIALDERRLPLDMVRASYHIGSVGPVHDAFLEGFAATADRVATFPGIPAGSPWEPGALGRPNLSVRNVAQVPDRWDVRGGARLVFNLSDATVTLAHYHTYLDVPGVRFRLPGAVQLPGEAAPSPVARFGNEIQARQTHPRVPITGASMTFPVPSLYTVVRSEIAWFTGEPMNRQGRGDSADALCPSPLCPDKAGLRRLEEANNIEGGLDPFVYPRFLDLTRKTPVWGRVLRRDTFNAAVGFDVNRFVRWLNPRQTFLITTQLFYKHVFDSPGDLALPVTYRNTQVAPTLPIIGSQGPLGLGCRDADGRKRPCALRPRLYHLGTDRFLQTLLVTTSYSGGRIVPSFGMFYDWAGTMVFQPGVVLTRDPFRVVMDYSRIEGTPTGQFGTVRDRDNVRFQFEYVF